MCLTHDDDGRIILNAVAGLTSSREQLEKANRVQGDRARRGPLGHYLGGMITYGLDVVCRSADGREKWRYVHLTGSRKVRGKKASGASLYAYKVEGIKIVPGNPVHEVCQGVPAHDDGDTTYLVPTIRTERLETIKRIYMLLDTEATNCNRIARMLNKEGVDPLLDNIWTSVRVRDLILNPVFIGKPAINKKGQPRFYEIQGGKATRIETRGKVKQKRRPESEWLMPSEPIFEPIVDPDRWKRVTEKFKVNSGHRAPKSDLLYLAGLVDCARCGKPMVGATVQRRSKKDGSLTGLVPYYQCSSRNSLGPDNPTGCGFYCTQGKLIEPYIGEFLASRGQTIDDLLSQERDTGALESLLRERSSTADEAGAIIRKMKSFVADHVSDLVDEDAVPGFVNPEDAPDIVRVYQIIRAHKVAEIRSQIIEHEAEHDACSLEARQPHGPQVDREDQ